MHHGNGVLWTTVRFVSVLWLILHGIVLYGVEWNCVILHWSVRYFMVLTSIDTVEVNLSDWHDTGAGTNENIKKWYILDSSFYFLRQFELHFHPRQTPKGSFDKCSFRFYYWSTTQQTKPASSLQIKASILYTSPDVIRTFFWIVVSFYHYLILGDLSINCNWQVAHMITCQSQKQPNQLLHFHF